MLLTSILSWLIYRSRLKGAWLLEILAFLPIAIPGIVLGMAMIMLYVAFPIPIYGTLWVLLIAYTTKYLPYGMRATSAAIVQIHRELEEAASVSGGNWLQTFFRVLLPLLRPGLAAGWIYICIVSFREFSTAVLLVGGKSMVLSLLVFTLFEMGQTTTVAALGSMMIVVLLVVVGVFAKLSDRVGVRM
jgi:iron(III) transport system permease protein